MPVIAVINRKGGSGKSTLATHLAAWWAGLGQPVMLGDVDRQHSTRTWLRLRDARGLQPAAPIVGWASDTRQVLRPPAGIGRVVLDTPGGLRGSELARVVMSADAIVMPVCASVFDRTSAAECHAELMTLPRVSSGRCRLAAVGMRVDVRTRGAQVLQQWAAARGLPFVGVLRDTQAYVHCIEQGLTLFDLRADAVQADLAQWRPILDWLDPVLQGPVAAPAAARTAPPKPTVVARVSPAEAAQALEALVTRRGQGALPAPSRRGSGWFDWLTRPRRYERSS